MARIRLRRTKERNFQQDFGGGGFSPWDDLGRIGDGSKSDEGELGLLWGM